MQAIENLFSTTAVYLHQNNLYAKEIFRFPYNPCF